jgi:nicotinamide mononucleotide adenylyltransferase
MTDLGVIHGRFQVFHNDHLKYVLAGKSFCRHLIVGITNPDPSLTKDDPADPQRSDPLSNPLTYYERYVMVHEALVGAGVPCTELSIVPFPVNLPDLYRYYVPFEATFYLTIYDEWGNRKLDLFHSVGLKTHVLWRRPREEKGLRSSDIRKKMVLGDPWQHLVPPQTASLMKTWRIPERLRTLHAARAQRTGATDLVGQRWGPQSLDRQNGE